MSQLYVVVLAVIVVVLLAVAVYRTSRVKTKADYLVAGRSLPAFVLVLTLLTSMLTFGSGRTNVLQGTVHLGLFLGYLLLIFIP